MRSRHNWDRRSTALTRLSQTLNSRNQTLGELLKGAADVTGILSATQRASQHVDPQRQRSAVHAGVAAPGDCASCWKHVRGRQALTGIVHDNESKLAPTLAKLNSVTAVLEKNRDNIAKALPGLAKYELTQGETVSSGFYYNPFIPNLFTLQFFQPFVDYAFGFRAYGAAGQPPDKAGPRALLPFPFNQNPTPPGQR